MRDLKALERSRQSFNADWEHFCAVCRTWQRTPGLPFEVRRVWVCEGCRLSREREGIEHGGGGIPIAGGEKGAEEEQGNRGVPKGFSIPRQGIGNSGGRPRVSEEHKKRVRREARRAYRERKKGES